MRRGGAWRSVDRDRTAKGGRFYVAWRPSTAGTYRLRLRFGGDDTRLPAKRRMGRALRVYRAGAASWYGPGLYGNRTACGGRLTPGTLGVANRWLPCGTKVTFRYRGRTVTVPVIDRGPYVDGRDLGPHRRHEAASSASARTGAVWSTR